MCSDVEAAEKRWVHETLRRHLQSRGETVNVGEPKPFGAVGNGFASKLFAVETSGRSLVVKILPGEPHRSMRHLDQQFANEAYFYSEVLPFLLEACDDDSKDALLSSSVASVFPQFFCAHEDSFQSLIAISNLSPLGYKLAGKSLDYAHVKPSLQELGRFHALSYVAKKKRPLAFEKIARGAKARNEQVPDETISLIKEFLKHAVDQFVKMFPEEAKRYANKFEKIYELTDKFRNSTDPDEPLAVLCHGDFNRNNLLFKYDDDDDDGGGVPSSLMLIDFQLATYSSPAIDLSLILFLSTAPEVRENHWDDLFRAYHRSLLDTMEKSLCTERKALEEEYSMDLMMEDFRKHCLHGFLTTIFFLPITMLPPTTLTKLDEFFNEELTPETVKTHVSFIVENSNERVLYCLATLIKEVLQRGLV